MITGPTGGYIVGFVLAAVLAGFLAQRRWDSHFNSAVAAMLSGNVVIYLFGLPWLAAKIDTGLEDTLEAGLYPFVVGDLFKLYLAGALLPAAWAAVKRFKGYRPIQQRTPASRPRSRTRRGVLGSPGKHHDRGSLRPRSAWRSRPRGGAASPEGALATARPLSRGSGAAGERRS